MELMQYKKTLSLLSAFTTAETMVNLEFLDFKPETCENCGQKRYGISRKFKEYFLKYIGDGDTNKKKFNSYYSFRSKIVHTGKQLKTEDLFSDVTQEEKDSELLNHLEIIQLGKMAILQWLLKNP